jgi:hypothetical protein
MGAAVSVPLSCPQDFDRGLMMTCQSRCPADFKYSLSGTTSNPGGQCIALQDNTVVIDLPSLPTADLSRREPPAFAAERTRFTAEVAKARGRVATNAETRTQLGLLNTQRTAQAADYSRIQIEYAGVASSADTTKAIRDASTSLKPFRPPTAPGSDIEKERQAILTLTNQHLLVAQIALFTVVLVLLTYAIVPAAYTHLVALLLIACGVAAAFFLRK